VATSRAGPAGVTPDRNPEGWSIAIKPDSCSRIPSTEHRDSAKSRPLGKWLAFLPDRVEFYHAFEVRWRTIPPSFDGRGRAAPGEGPQSTGPGQDRSIQDRPMQDRPIQDRRFSLGRRPADRGGALPETATPGRLNTPDRRRTGPCYLLQLSCRRPAHTKSELRFASRPAAFTKRLPADLV
jgi:hypothetical protein